MINPPHVFVKGERYVRIRFINSSSTNQTFFRLYTYFGSFDKLTSPINAVLAQNYDAIVTRPTSYNDEVAMGKRQGRRTWHKFGFNLDVDTGSEELLASFNGTIAPSTDIMTVPQTFTITYDNLTDGATSTGARTLLIDYLDENFLNQQVIHVLGSTGSDTTAFTGLGINREVVISTGGDEYNNNQILTAATVDTTLQAGIPAQASVTQQLLLHTQIGHNFLMKEVGINVLKLSGGGGSPRVTIRGYSWSRVTNTRYEVFRKSLDTDVENTLVFPFSEPLVFGGREVIYFTAETDINNTSISGRFIGIEEKIV